MVYRIYAEKKPEFAVEAAALKEELCTLIGLQNLQSLRILHRYDVEGISSELFDTCCQTVFSEPPVDLLHRQLPAAAHRFAISYLPGQFDQRADSAAECIQLISQGERPLVRSAKVYLLEGSLSSTELEEIKNFLINPVESQEESLEEKATLHMAYPQPEAIPVLDGFTGMDAAERVAFRQQWGLAMDEEDLAFCQAYFQQEGRNPTLTELRMIDTYWSDHCRHTTFSTHLDQAEIEDINTQNAYNLYKELRKQLYSGKNKPETLMDLAVIGAKALQHQGRLHGVDESEEINACSVHITADIGGKEEPWLLLFKNETHNHPTEIEPFGGAATCIGGAIRDPLANRGYVFGAMRVTGAGDPLAPVSATLPGKLPQRKLVQTAAAGYSSYGNQIGLATGQVKEYYHPGYLAKRMELGAVLGAVPLSAVRRDTPEPGDVVLLLGGATGRDGCGGATGSSKAHKLESLANCGAEVQKGNAPVERKLQRLFRNPEATRLIRRCNDFGAGGVSVAIGELADGLEIDLDAVPKKYEGLTGTELAISESQERMAVVVEKADLPRFTALAAAENLSATHVATVTKEPRLKMRWQGQLIADLSRVFLNSSGAEKHAEVFVPPLPVPQLPLPEGATLAEKLQHFAAALPHCGQKGLAERFDSTIGAASVLMPFGGKHQLSPTQGMVMKLPTLAETTTCAGMAHGFSPAIAQQNPYAGAYLAVLESLARLSACGLSHKNAYLSFQEYFERLGQTPARWGKPFSALLGALAAQLDFGAAAIGGKDSMSGSFENLDVPPALISFAVAAGHAGHVTGPEWKTPGHTLVWLRPQMADAVTPEAASCLAVMDTVESLLRQKKAVSAWACGEGGLAEALCCMAFGNRLGLRLAENLGPATLFAPAYGSFVLELAGEAPELQDLPGCLPLGTLTEEYALLFPAEAVPLGPLQEAYEAKLEPVFPYRQPSGAVAPPALRFEGPAPTGPKLGIAKPKALVPVFPGTNCEYDTARALERAGASAEIFIICNRSADEVAQSAKALAAKIAESQMLVFPGGFSGGDEPDGSAKLIASFFRAPALTEEVSALLENRDGLILGICNGFQALIKLGLVPYGKICAPSPSAPTLTFNAIGRHQSMMVRTRVASTLSPWLAKEPLDSIQSIPISHGEGRFTAPPEVLESLIQNGQIATQYVDLEGNPSMDVRFNPAGSLYAIEGICSPTGRVLGKMAHSERSGQHLHVNVPGHQHQKLFESGVYYFS